MGLDAPIDNWDDEAIWATLDERLATQGKVLIRRLLWSARSWTT